MKLAGKGGQETHLEVNKSFAITASDTVDVTIIGAIIHVNETGFYNILLSGNITPVKMYLIAGVTYPFRIQRLYVTDTDIGCVDGLIGLSSVTSINDKA